MVSTERSSTTERNATTLNILFRQLSQLCTLGETKDASADKRECCFSADLHYMLLALVQIIETK